VIDAQAGVEPQTETVWRQATEYKVPRIVYVNKMDKIGADFKHAIKTIHSRLGVKANAIQLPIGSENDFNGIIDLVTMTAVQYTGDADENTKDIEIPAHLLEEAKQLRFELIEAVAEYDEELMMTYLEGGEVTVELIKRAIRKGTLAVDFFPVVCGSSFKNKGVKKVLDAAIDYLPSPLDIPPVVGHNPEGEEIVRHASDDEPFTALAFKVMTDPFVGKLTFFRVYSGHITSGSYIKNTTKDERER